MRVEIDVRGPCIEMTLNPDQADLEFSRERFSQRNNSFVTMLPAHMKAEDIHCDHLALIATIVAYPFTKEVLILPLKVSEKFMTGLHALSRFTIVPISKDAKAYAANDEGKATLSFSGGIDSTAVLCLLPKDSAIVFLNRPKRFGVRSLYNKSAPLAIMDFVEKQGYDVYQINCDVEYIRNPLGFPVDIAAGIPAIAIASVLGHSSVAYGTVMESAYRIGHDVARVYANSSHYRLWGQAFKGAGLFLTLPVAGVSEVGTSMIVEASPYSKVSYSCIRGKWPNPCGNCWKCFRKSLVESRLRNNEIDEEMMEKWLKVKEVRIKLSKRLISHENVLSWALSGQNITGKSSDLLRGRLEGMERDLDHLTRWFPPALEHVHESHREHVQQKLNEYLEQMSEMEIEKLLEHDIRAWLSESNSMKRFHKFLNSQGLEPSD